MAPGCPVNQAEEKARLHRRFAAENLRCHNWPNRPRYSGSMMTSNRPVLGRAAFLLALLTAPLLMQAPAHAQAPAPAPAAAGPAQKAAQPPASGAQPQPVAPAAKPGEAAPAADDQTDANTAGDRAIERMKTRIKELEARTDVAPDIRDQGIAQLRNALGQFEAASASAAAAKRFQESAQKSAERVAEAKQQLDALAREPGEDEFAKRVDKLPLTEAQQALDAANSGAATIKSDLDQLESRLREMSTRATSAREEQTAEKQALDALENAGDGSAGDPNPILVDARKAANMAERRARAAKLNLLEQEVISLPARQASATARRDLAAAKYDKLAKRVPLIEAHVNKLKDAEAAKKQAETDREAKRLSAQHPVLESYVKDTEVIRQRGADATRSLDEGKSKLAEIQSDLARVRDSKVAAQQVLEIGSIGGEFSELLRAMRAQLPDTASLQRRIDERDQAIVDARLRRLQAEEARRALSDFGGMADKVLAAYAKKEGDPPIADAKPALAKLVSARRDLYVQLHDALVTRIAQLAELNGAERDLLNQTTQLRALLNSRLLWLPSSGFIGIGWLDQVRASFVWIADVGAWKETGQVLLQRAIDRPVPTALVLLAFGALVAFSRRLIKRLGSIAEAVGRYSTDNYVRSPEALLISALLAIKTPLLFGYAGWLLLQPPQAPDFAVGVGAGLLAAASLLAFLRLIQFIAAPNGLFSAHFGWSERARATLSANIVWLKYAVTPIAFILGMINVSSAQNLRDGLGRFAFLAGALAVSLFLARVADPRRGVFAERLSPSHPLWMTRVVWHTLISLAPLAIAGLALWGYYDGASQIRDGVLLSVAIIVGAFLVYSLAMREVLVARRRMEIHRANERREKARAQAAAAQEINPATGELQPPPVSEPEVDIASISDQTRQLVRLGVFLLLGGTLYFFWREALPSLALLDVPLWQQVSIVDGAARSVPVTVSNVVIALVIATVTWIATRNLPGLLEITALHRLRIEAGTRYAISAVSRYLIAIVGIIFAFRSIGFDWSQVQWIVAALGVGVGFGLQEIVANFISGLIILFERPVRVGDTVTIGDLTGTVSRIHIRATSMTDGENREIIIPNKSLITEKVINWTLTDSITRVTLKIGIAYGTDTLRAQMSILEAVKATPQVLDTPPPSVFFVGFGAKGLEFEVRAFVLQLTHRSSVINDLHVAIERALRERQIAMS
jgi:potassium efflux system protein